MGAGRPIKSVQDHMLDGTYRADRHAKRELVVETGTLAPPPWLDEEAVHYFNYYASVMRDRGLDANIFSGVISLLAEAHLLREQAQKDVVAYGRIITSNSATHGGEIMKQNPACADVLKLNSQIKSLLSELGLTPSSAEKTQNALPQKEAVDDAFAMFTANKTN